MENLKYLYIAEIFHAQFLFTLVYTLLIGYSSPILYFLAQCFLIGGHKGERY